MPRSTRIATICVALVACVAGGGAAGLTAVVHLRIGLSIDRQPAWLAFTEHMNVVLRTKNELDTQLAGTIEAEVPMRQTLEVPLRGRYRTETALEADIPVEFTVTYEGVLPVDTVAEVAAEIDINYQEVKQIRDVAIRAWLPLKLALPVKLVVPVKEVLRVRYQGPVAMVFDQVLHFPIDTTLSTNLIVNERVLAPITAAFPLDMQFPKQPQAVVLDGLDLSIRPQALRVSVGEDASGPRRRSEREFSPPGR